MHAGITGVNLDLNLVPVLKKYGCTALQLFVRQLPTAHATRMPMSAPEKALCGSNGNSAHKNFCRPPPSPSNDTHLN